MTSIIPNPEADDESTSIIIEKLLEALKVGANKNLVAAEIADALRRNSVSKKMQGKTAKDKQIHHVHPIKVCVEDILNGGNVKKVIEKSHILEEREKNNH